MILLLGFGVFMSTFSTVRTLGIASRSLAMTQDTLDPDAESLTSVWSLAALSREFTSGEVSFMGVYQYTDFDLIHAPAWFAGSTLTMFITDVALCVLASGLLAFKGWGWWMTYYITTPSLDGRNDPEIAGASQDRSRSTKTHTSHPSKVARTSEKNRISTYDVSER
jgi:hypothetical protein